MSDSLRETLQSDLKIAMKAGDDLTRDVIRFTLSALGYVEIEKKGPLTAGEELELLQRETKRRQESIEQFTAGGRLELVERETMQLAVLQKYLPAQMTDSELQEIVMAAVSETGATQPRDMGRVMPVVIRTVAGRADGKRISNAVKAALSPPSC